MISITQYSSEQVTQHMDELVHLLKLTVDNGASIGWIAPLAEYDATTYWLEVASQIESGNKILLIAQQEEKIVGLVQLALEPRKNGNHRAEVQKLMVHLDFRRQGFARQLMEALDSSARQANRTLLILDVRKNDPAETLYQKMGYVHVGDIPVYARSSNMQLDATAFYYKLLS